MSKTQELKVAIIGIGTIGRILAINLTKGFRAVMPASRNYTTAQNLANELGNFAQPKAISAAVQEADIIVVNKITKSTIMKISLIKLIGATAMLIATIEMAAQAQEYVLPTKPAQTGRSPGVKVKLLSTNGQTKTYVLIFSKGDEVVSGLTEFAQKYKVKSAHYTAIGDALSAKVGFFDYKRKQFKAIPIGESEVSSLLGDIAVYNDKPVAHTHINLATEDGISHGGHLLELFVGPTLEVFMTVEPTPLYKRLSPEFEAGIIDLSLKK